MTEPMSGIGSSYFGLLDAENARLVIVADDSVKRLIRWQLTTFSWERGTLPLNFPNETW